MVAFIELSYREDYGRLHELGLGVALKILVVENNPTVAKLLVYFFEQAGCEVETVVDGLEALVKLDGWLPDILVTDIIMPKISGDQLCRIIRSDKKLKHLFVVIYSSILLEDRNQILDLDADIYVAKGSSQKYKEQVEKILQQYNSGERRNTTILGTEKLHIREVTAELLLARRHAQTIFDNIADAVFELNIYGQIIQANKAAHKLFQSDLKTLLSTNFLDYVEGPYNEEITAWLEQLSSGGSERYQTSYEKPCTIGGEMVALKMVALNDDNDIFVIVIIQVITSQKKVEERLERTLMELDAVMQTIDYGVLFLDRDLNARMVNRAFLEMWDVSQQQIDEKKNLRELMYLRKDLNVPDVSLDKLEEYLEKRIERIKQGPLGPLTVKRKGGRFFEFNSIELPDQGRLLTFYDITTLKNAQEELAATLEEVQDLAHRDPLTKLANLRFAKDQLHLSLELAARHDEKLALLFLDLDGFKVVNDTLGHEKGDEVLIEVAARMVAHSRASDTLARIGGDEFIVIQTGVRTKKDVDLVAKKLIKAINEPYILGEDTAHIGVSIGIAMYPDDGTNDKELLKKADRAMYTIKGDGKNGFAYCR